MATAKKPSDQNTAKKPGGQVSRPSAGTTKPGSGQSSRPSSGTNKPGSGQTSKPGSSQPARPGSGTTRAGGMSADALAAQAARKPAAQQKVPAGTTSTSTSQTFLRSELPVPPVPPAPTQAVLAPAPVNWEDAAKELYGGYFSIVDSVPELRDLLRRATQEKWSDSRFEYELRQTQWWKQNSATAREWDLQSQLDPASAQQQVANRVTELQNMALSQFQIELNPTQIQKLATDSLRFGWTQQQVMNAIGFEATRSQGGLSQLASGFIGQNLRQTANAYGLKLSQDMLDRWTTAIATGQETRERFQTYAVNTAKTLFPAISGQLDSGLTFQQVVDPYRNVASQILEITPESIDFLDPKWARAISSVEANGQQRMMSFSEWGDYLRNDRSLGYEYTSDAQQRAFKVANDLANLFGRV